jgi:hypothetical protein
VTGRMLQLRMIVVGAWILLVVAAQATSLVFNTGRLWPFNSIPVFYKLSNTNDSFSNEVYLVGPEGETNVVATGIADRHLTLSFIHWLDRAQSKRESDHVAELYFSYAKRRISGPFPYFGLRIYRRNWDLNQGKITKSVLRAEYLTR